MNVQWAASSKAKLKHARQFLNVQSENCGGVWPLGAAAAEIEVGGCPGANHAFPVFARSIVDPKAYFIYTCMCCTTFCGDQKSFRA